MRIYIAALLASAALQAQTYKDIKATAEERAQDLLSKMTLEEKIDYMGGYKDFYIRGIERLGLPEIKMTDGPVGTRNYGNTTAYPASVLTAASWDTDLAYKLGEALGKDAKERGVHILLAPGVNIYRAPMNGRNFEYLGEDPYLSGKMAVPYIKGVQSQGVVATVKHFAANNQEWDRNNVSSDMDERTLQEIYLPAFKMAVKEGQVGAVMNSYNLINGDHATQNAHLNNDILKGDWKFDGILMSDWVATYDGVAAAKNGLDLEMPSGKFMNKETLLPAIKKGTLSEKVIDDHVLRILRIIFRFGFYDQKYQMAANIKDNPDNAKVALELARGGMVLLKNDNILPLSKSIKSIAVIGPNADSYIAGGGSSYTHPFHSVSLVEGIKKAAPSSKVTLVKNAVPTLETYVEGTPFYTSKGSAEKGLKADFFANKTLEGKPIASTVDKNPNHNWNEKPDVDGVPADNFSMRYTGVVRPEKTGAYKFGVRGDDGFRLYVDGNEILNEWSDHAALLRIKELSLEAGKEYEVKLEFYENGGEANIAFAVYQENIKFDDAVKAAKSSDVAIVSIGFDSNSEGEGFDRTFELPPYQADLIKAVSEANPKTIVVLNAGGNVYMQDWLANAKGLLHAWFPGQEGGTAAADILFGKVNPSGKLPASFEKEWKDNPTYNNYYDPDGDKRVSYKEGLNVGYRYYDKTGVKPQFPFGFGLSYTTFEYSNLKIDESTKGMVLVSYTIKNTGKYDGAEVSQLYVSQLKSTVDRPVKELKGFCKTFLKKGESKTVTLKLDTSAFSYYKTDNKAFGYDAGTFEINVGASSQDLRLKGQTVLH
ncbi:glycoside hydrolase family 3 C-terminal domain-containing protein [Flavobacterium sp. MAH-1]|uniref:Glycoside hydrolase family 3 C-terminal domain-containing protein n=1 Tax=Flavobacterium agri TaxID=2743471 RepID=A0A7Y9C7I1_9FLAO|nr:glycoside hydrolase family 3 protein [Flavobacterium agri]NUY82385.1 glycoside hydrolase family 3 C-terminal domain-containing protein [Flavobacterium agri]NYA72409.1 glycoside hydrolase family 3 C-terminal domain-containing protein [Flavobacterium agri]